MQTAGAVHDGDHSDPEAETQNGFPPVFTLGHYSLSRKESQVGEAVLRGGYPFQVVDHVRSRCVLGIKARLHDLLVILILDGVAEGAMVMQ